MCCKRSTGDWAVCPYPSFFLQVSFRCKQIPVSIHHVNRTFIFLLLLHQKPPPLGHISLGCTTIYPFPLLLSSCSHCCHVPNFSLFCFTHWRLALPSFLQTFPSALSPLSTSKATSGWRLYLELEDLSVCSLVTPFILQAFVLIFLLTLFCDFRELWSWICSLFNFLCLSDG